MAFTRKPVSSDPAKPVYIICKRIILILSYVDIHFRSWDPSSVNNGAERTQLREDGQSIGETITMLLTKVQMEGQGKLSVLKRLHLAPEQIRHDVDMILYTNSPDKIKSCVKSINQVLKDIEALTLSREGVEIGGKSTSSAKVSNIRSKLDETQQSAKITGGLVGQRACTFKNTATESRFHKYPSDSTRSRHDSYSSANTQSGGLVQYAVSSVNLDSPNLNLSEDFGKLTLEFEKVLENTSKHESPLLKPVADTTKSKIKVIPVPSVPQSAEPVTVLSKSILRNNSESSHDSTGTVKTLEVFLKYQQTTAKAKWTVSDGAAGLKDLFTSKFPEMPPGFEVQILDPNYNKFYKLNDVNDVCNGSVLTVQRSRSTDEPSEFHILGKKLDRLSNLVQSHLIVGGNISNSEMKLEKKNSELKLYLNQISGLKAELESLKSFARNLMNDTNHSITSQLAFIKSKLKKQQNSAINEQTKKCNQLLADFKEFSFFLETTRVDLTRKVRPGELCKKKIETEMELLLFRQSTLHSQLADLKALYKKQWEVSLQSVLSEQQSVSDMFDKLNDIDEIAETNVDLANNLLPVLRHQIHERDVRVKRPNITVWSADQVKSYGMELIVAELSEKDYDIDRSHIIAIVDKQRKLKVLPENEFQSSITNAKLKNVGGIEKIELELEQKKINFLKGILKSHT
ncbi:Bud site selection protein 6 [Terramyces sp. JEL0728]|nr:Bud site selection protein 6 [Terramyces sp. JEL0728]